jgi:MFS transporter, DHA2 family, multidrug resistance protein
MREAMTTTGTTRAGRREWVGLAVLALPCLLISVNMTVLVYAVPAMSADLAPSGAQLLWIMDVYSFLLAGTLVTMGTLGDRIGRRRLLLVGAVVFGGASVMCAFSSSPGMLIAARALLGVAAATLNPSTLALIRNMFHDGQERRVAVSVWSASLAGGALVGPLLGGLLLDHFWWGSVFLINVPFMVLLLVAGPLLLPEHRDPGAGRIDLTSAVLSLAAVLPLVYGVKTIAEDGLRADSVGALVVGVVLGVVFWKRQKRSTNPLLDVGLLRAPGFSAALATGAVALFAITGIGVSAGQYMQLVLGLRPFEAGLWSLPPVLVTIISSALAPALTRRIRPAVVIGAGLGLAAVGLAMMFWTGTEFDRGLTVIVVGNTVAQAGLGVVLTLVSDLVITTAPPERAGAASGLSQTAQEFGGALGIAVLGTVVTAMYQAAIPPGYPEEARETLGGAVAVAARTAGAAGQELLQLARTGFTDGLEVAALVSAVLMAATAVVAGLVLRRATPPSASAPER